MKSLSKFIRMRRARAVGWIIWGPGSTFAYLFIRGARFYDGFLDVGEDVREAERERERRQD